MYSLKYTHTSAVKWDTWCHFFPLLPSPPKIISRTTPADGRGGGGETTSCRSSSLLQAGMRPESEYEKDLGEFSLQEGKREGIGSRKDWTPVSVPWSSDTMHKLIWEHNFFLLSHCLCLLRYSSRTQETKVLNY